MRNAVIAVLALAMPAYAATINVTPVQIVETRVKQFGKKVKFGADSEMQITLHVEGEQVNDAVSYGTIEFEQAVDDAGGDLKPGEKEKGFLSSGGKGKFTPLRDGMMGMDQEEGEAGFRILFRMGLSSRKATKISRFKGQFPVLAGGEKKTVAVKKVKSLMGKNIEDPVLTAAGLQVTVPDPKKDKDNFLSMGGPNSLPLKFQGDLKVLQKVDVKDAQGESVVGGHMATGMGKTKMFSYDLDKPLDDTMTVEIHLVVGPKTVVVPFDLKDVELP